MVILPDLAALAERVGEEIAVSEWVTIDQERVQLYAAATGDYQWIHTDPERAERDSLYGTTILHGFMLLAILPTLVAKAFSVQGGFRMILNCGVRVARFLRPVPTGSALRARFTLLSVEPVMMGYETIWTVVIERDGAPKPVADLEWVIRYLR